MGLHQRLTPYTVIGLDSSIFIYQLEADPTRLALTNPIFNAIANGEKRAVTSVIALLEINVRPMQLKREDIARQYEAVLANFPNLIILDISREITRQATRLRAEYGFRTPDAIQIAACLQYKADVFLTNDRHLSRIKSSMDVIVLDDLLKSP
jgi:predicted nucleic acid-binding protein